MSIGPVSSGQGSLLSNPGLLQALYPNIDLTAFSQLEQQQELALEQPLQALSSQISNLNQISSTWSSIQAAVNQLQSDASALSNPTTWSSSQASSSNTAVVAAKSAAGAQAGTYTVSVTTVGQNDQWLSQSESSATSALGLSGSFTINGTSVQVGTTDTLDTIASAINSAAAGATAQVLTSQSGGTTSYYLEISSTNDSALTITDPNGIFAGTGSSGLGMTETQKGQAWQYSVNGVSTSSTTGTDSTTVPDLTLTLAGLGSATVSVTSSTSTAQSDLNQFTSDYNALVSQINQATGKGAILEGDPTAEGIAGQINQILLSSNSSLPSGYQSPTDVGMTLALQPDKTTKLEFSSTTFSQAVSSNPAAVENIFTGSGGVMGQLSTLLQNLGQTGTGIIASTLTGIQTQVQDLTMQQSSEQDLITMQQNAMQAQFQQEMQALIAVSVQAQSVSGLFSQLTGQSQSGNGSGSSSSPAGG